MLEKFQKLSKVVRVILLVIPFVNWIVEIVLRWERFLEKKDVMSLVFALIATFFLGNILGWIDAIWTVLEDKIAFLDVELK